jgi:hypothetical protein
VTQEVTNHLFQEPGKKWGMDLAAINMQRGREQGIPGYGRYEERKFIQRLHKITRILRIHNNFPYLWASRDPRIKILNFFGLSSTKLIFLPIL